MTRISKYFFNGLITIVPIAITMFVISKMFSFAEEILGRHLPVQFPGIGLITVFLLIVLIGWMSSHWLTKKLLALGEKIVDTIPVVKFIYKSVKQVSTAMFESQQLFNQAVLVPYPHPGVKSLGFVMSALSTPIAANLNDEHVCVFIPMSLNMTAGFNIIVPKRDIIPLNITAECALQYVLTAGALMPQENTHFKK